MLRIVGGKVYKYYYEIKIDSKTIMATESLIEARLSRFYVKYIKGLGKRVPRIDKHKHTKDSREIFKNGVEENVIGVIMKLDEAVHKIRMEE